MHLLRESLPLVFVLAWPLHAATVVSLSVFGAVPNGGPNGQPLFCVDKNSGPTAACQVTGTSFTSGADASISGSVLVVHTFGGDATAEAKAMLDNVYFTRYVGSFSAVTFFVCTILGGNVSPAPSPSASVTVGSITRTCDSPVTEIVFPVIAANGQFEIQASWSAYGETFQTASSVVGPPSAVISRFAIVGFQDAAGNPVAATLLPEPATWGMLTVGVLAFSLARTRLRFQNHCM